MSKTLVVFLVFALTCFLCSQIPLNQSNFLVLLLLWVLDFGAFGPLLSFLLLFRATFFHRQVKIIYFQDRSKSQKPSHILFNSLSHSQHLKIKKQL